jgi:hypothetical protein
MTDRCERNRVSDLGNDPCAKCVGHFVPSIVTARLTV